MKYRIGDRVTVKLGSGGRPAIIEGVGIYTGVTDSTTRGRYTDEKGGPLYLPEYEHSVAPIDFHADGSKPVRDEQPKPLEPLVRKRWRPSPAAAPPQAEARLSAMLTEHGSAHGYTEDPVVTLERLLAGTKRDTLPAPPSCPHCADNAGMLDAACKRLGEREVEHASALRELTRITAEFRKYRKEHR